MKELKLKILELKLEVQEDYAKALETENFQRANYLRGKLNAINVILKMLEVD